MIFSYQQIAPSESWKACFQNTLEACTISNPLPTQKHIISHPSQTQCVSFCPWVLSLCFNKTIFFLHQRCLKSSFLAVGPKPQHFSTLSVTIIMAEHVGLLLYTLRSVRAGQLQLATSQSKGKGNLKVSKSLKFLVKKWMISNCELIHLNYLEPLF